MGQCLCSRPVTAILEKNFKKRKYFYLTWCYLWNYLCVATMMEQFFYFEFEKNIRLKKGIVINFNDLTLLK